jgi:hypothetical protein
MEAVWTMLFLTTPCLIALWAFMVAILTGVGAPTVLLLREIAPRHILRIGAAALVIGVAQR